MENGEIMKRPIKVPTKAPFIRAAGLIPLFLESANICTPFMSWENRDNLLILQNFYQYVNDSLEDEKIRRGSKINPIERASCQALHQKLQTNFKSIAGRVSPFDLSQPLG
jgi:hypothetical protein